MREPPRVQVNVNRRLPISPRTVAAAAIGLPLVAAAVALILLGRQSGGTADASPTSSDTPRPSVATSSPEPTASPLGSRGPSPTPEAAAPTPEPLGCSPVAELAQPHGARDLAGGWIDLTEALGGGSVNAIASSTSRTVAVGSHDTDFMPMAWYTDDGRILHRARLPDFPTETHVGALGLIAHGPCGWVALGFDLQRDLIGRGPARTFALHSTDGATWTSVPVPDECSRATNLIAGPFGYVATGSPCDQEFDPFPMQIWWSADGRTWNRVPYHPGMDEVVITELATDGAMIVGFDAGSSADDVGSEPTWVSPDGRAWDLAATDLSPKIHLATLEGTPSGFYAAGGLVRDGEPAGVGCWSRDGRAWDCEGYDRSGIFAGEPLAWDGEEFVTLWSDDSFDGTAPNQSRFATSADGSHWSTGELDPDELIFRDLVATPFGLFTWGGTEPRGEAVSEPFLLLSPD